jgi:hypothetical protein
MMRDCQMYLRKVAPSKKIINCSNHGFMLKHSVLTLYRLGNILFQTMLVNSDVLLVPNVLDPLAIFRNWRSRLTSLRILRRVANE